MEYCGYPVLRIASMPEIKLDDLLIREIAAGDATATASLSEELAYPVSPDIMRQRIEFLNRLEGHVVYVACLSGDVVGWCRFFCMRL
jgi:hypothetical protein